MGLEMNPPQPALVLPGLCSGSAAVAGDWSSPEVSPCLVDSHPSPNIPPFTDRNIRVSNPLPMMGKSANVSQREAEEKTNQNKQRNSG